MRLAFITAGAAGMYCGSCMRDNTLASALIALGHDALLVPTFTPITTDEADQSTRRVFLGGVNVYLQEKFWLFRHTPRFVDRMLNARWLLKFVSRFSSNTDYSRLGNLTASMLEGRHGRQRKEMTKLVDYLNTDVRPEAVILTNALLSGLVPPLQSALGVPIYTTLQGDDIFLDALPDADRERCIRLIRANDASTTGYISTSTAYADFMSAYLGVPREKIHVVYPGINPRGHAATLVPRPERPPTIGYFARISPEKGFDHLVDAFLHLKRQPGTDAIRLRYAGWLGEKNRSFHDSQLGKLRAAGLDGSVEHVPCSDHSSKVRFLQSLDVLSVPTSYREPKGLYVLEAWANGVPVVQPSHGSFPELIQQTGGGRLVPPGDAAALARAWQELLHDEPTRLEMARRGWEGFHAHFTAGIMAANTLRLLQTRSPATPHPEIP